MKQIFIILILAIGIITSCQKENFTHSGMASDHFFLQNDGQNMPVLVAGNLDSKKMILILHGGPGASSLYYREPFVRDVVEKEFVIVYWDQRYAGMTQGNGGSTDINVFRDDVKKLIQLLKVKYGADQEIYLFGVSWGGFLAPYFLLHDSNEQMVKGWIQVDGAHNYSLNDSLTKEMLLVYGDREINAGRNTDFWKEVVDWCKKHDYRDIESSRKLNKYATKAEDKINEIDGYNLAKVTLTDNRSMGSLWSNSTSSYFQKIHLQAYDHTNSEELYKLTLPVLLLWGKYDFICPTGLADDIEANIGSTDVQKIIFEHSGHNAAFIELNLFWSEVINWMRKH
jgi:pimeloyl-ACP methyl ester carboxylesterase